MTPEHDDAPQPGPPRTPADTRAFYDGLAPTYREIFADWDATVRYQGRVLAELIEADLGPGPQRVLDCACGIGTQVIGLALRGHAVTGSDLSAAAIERARAECVRAGAVAVLAPADMRSLPYDGQAFDVVLCADNSLPHLLAPSDVRTALSEMRRVLRPGGLVVVTVRDYDAVLLEHPTGTAVQRSSGPDGLRTVTNQVWDWWPDERTYTLTHLQTKELSPGVWAASGRDATYRAWSRAELTDLAAAAGLAAVRWLTPQESGYYQPVMLARRAHREGLATGHGKGGTSGLDREPPRESE